VLTLGAALLLPARAEAIGLGVDVGAGSWLLEGLQADLHLRVEQEFFDMLKIGVRPGVELTLNQPTSRFGVPLDAFVRVKLAIVYLEALGGMYWVPSSVDPIRAHLAGGVGLQIWKFSFGVEVGYLQPSLNVLGRVGFTFF
jgi:hypothetical protein